MLETKHKEAPFASAWLVETFELLGAEARQSKSASALVATSMLETNHKEAPFASAWLVETFELLGAEARQSKSASALVATSIPIVVN
ncbi:hypothetical protein RJD24_05125 [Bacillaceae bacterium IKA-2]|nr:hypothetical protein RJD24_05125 [Bacillaceae bacterium IKA-2]